MSTIARMTEETVEFENGRQLSRIFCDRPDILLRAGEKLRVKLIARDARLQIEGEAAALGRARRFFTLMAAGRDQGLTWGPEDFLRMVEQFAGDEESRVVKLFEKPVVVAAGRKSIVPRTINQKRYLETIDRHPVVFGIGPAGTGKTYLAMAAAIAALVRGDVQRLVLARPAVEAGEALGFLPGDLREKILPYLRPIYDAMYEMLEREEAERLIEKGVIEIAPLAYMRGRTLTKAFVVLDEAQNTTTEQMMMFLTRLGEGSRMVVTGDITQIDLPRSRLSGLIEARRALADVAGVDFLEFGSGDVVRHPIVQRIIEAYALHRESPETNRTGGKT